MVQTIMNEAIKNTIETIKAGTLGVNVVFQTIPNWTSKKTTNNPYVNRVEKRTYITDCALGISYTNTVESHAKKSGVDTTNTPYEPTEPKGMHYPNTKGKKDYRYLISNSVENQLYLNIIYRGNENVRTEYYLDGVLVEKNSELEKDIKTHIKPSAPSKKQLDYGVEKDRLVAVNRPKFQNILSITQGVHADYQRDRITAYRKAE